MKFSINRLHQLVKLTLKLKDRAAFIVEEVKAMHDQPDNLRNLMVLLSKSNELKQIERILENIHTRLKQQFN